MKTLIYNQDYPPIIQDISSYLEIEYQSKLIESLSIFPDENYRWELVIMNKKIIIETNKEKEEIKSLLKLIKKYIE
jgi:hypothetical protein